MALRAFCLALALGVASGQFGLPTFKLPDLIVFGDSLSDTGNMYELFGQTFPNATVYWQGRFTNSPGSWVDQVKGAFQTVPDILFPNVINYAYGGATACTYPNITGKQAIIPSMQKMVAQYLSKPIKPGKKVYVLWGGHNDIMSAPKLPTKKQMLAVPVDVIKCTMSMTRQLLAADPEGTVLVASLAPLQLTPYLKNFTLARSLINQLNKGIKAGTRTLSLLNKGRAAYWDINDLLTQNINKIDTTLFPKGASKPCVTYGLSYDGFFKNLAAKPVAVCPDPNNHVFYDPVHPSARAHAVIARAYYSRLAELKLTETALRTMLDARIGI